MTSEIQTINLHDLIKEFIKTSINNNPFIMKTRKHKAAFNQNLKRITLDRINQMVVIDSEDHFRLLKDSKTGMYVVFNGLVNQTHFSYSFKDAQQFFNRLIKTTN